ncbi:MAG: alpha/beta hydrolase [Burkholderiaceae bacterium]
MAHPLIDKVRLEVLHVAAGVSAGVAGRAPLVFLHEGLGSVARWRDWPQTLCARTGRDGWIYSRQGYGASEAVRDVRGPPTESQGVRSGRLLPDYMHREAWTVLPPLLASWGINRPVLVGHSDGGTIALLHASRYPVSACIVMAPHVIVEDVSVSSITQAREAFEHGDLRQRLARYHRDVDGAFWQWNDIWLSPAFRDFDIRQECQNIGAPVLAIQGMDDPYGTLAQINGIDLPAPQIRREVLAQCGHSPHRDQPDKTNALIADFLAPLN